MTNQILKNYRTLLRKIDHDKARIKSFEFYKDPADIATLKQIKILQKKISDNNKMAVKTAMDICDFVENCPDIFLREVMMLRFIDGCSWEKVSVKMGGYNRADNLRKMVSRYLAKSEKEKLKEKD